MATTKLKRSIRKFRELYELLAQLDGRPVGVGEQIIVRPYRFKDSEETRKTIRKNLRLLRSLEEDYQEGLKSIRREVSGGKDDVDTTDLKQVKEFLEKNNALLDLVEEIDGFVSIDRAKLQIGENDIPNTLVDKLEPLLTAEGEETSAPAPRRNLLARLKPAAPAAAPATAPAPAS